MSMAVFLVMMVLFQMHVELCPLDMGALLAGGMEVVSLEFKLGQFVLKPAQIDSQVDQCADKHVSTDAAEEVKIDRFHLQMRVSVYASSPEAKALIWLAA